MKKVSALILGIIICATSVPAFAQLKPKPKEDLDEQKRALGLMLDRDKSLIAKKMLQGDSLAELQMNFRGTFWRDPEYVSSLGLTADQQKRMEETFRTYRLKLIDINAALQ